MTVREWFNKTAPIDILTYMANNANKCGCCFRVTVGLDKDMRCLYDKNADNPCAKCMEQVLNSELEK